MGWPHWFAIIYAACGVACGMFAWHLREQYHKAFPDDTDDSNGVLFMSTVLWPIAVWVMIEVLLEVRRNGR